ncbi:MAG TPA: Ig-like domain-containing protein [Casimicrobiaceae bacterium]
MRNLIRFAVTLLVCSVAVPLHATSFWMANASEVRRIDLAGASPDVRVPIANVVRLAATGGGGAFALTKEHLIRIDSEGIVGAVVDIGAMGYGMPSLLAVDVHDDTAWVATHGNLLIHVSVDGEVDAGTTLPVQARALAVALDRTLWASGADSLWQYSSAAQMLQSIPIGRSAGAIAQSLHVDSLRDRVWVVGRHDVIAVDSAHGTTTAMDTSGDTILSSSFDVGDGTLWILTRRELIAYDSDGVPLHRESLDEMKIEDARAVALDVGAGAMVVASPDRLYRLDPNGIEEARVHSLGRDLLLADRPSHFELWLTLYGLPEGESTPTRLPTFTGVVDALCDGAVCALTSGYWRALRSFNWLDGVSIAGEFQVDAASRVFQFVATSPLPPGMHRFSTQTIDRFGHRSNHADLTFDVLGPADRSSAPGTRAAVPEGALPAKAPNQPPTVTVAAPVNGATYSAGANITLTAIASDSDGTISKVEFYRGGGTLLGTVSTPPYTVVWNNVPAGSYAITAKAYDNKNGNATSTAVSVSVVANLPPTVTLTAPTDGTSVLAGAAINLSATASDPDGAVARVEFYDGATLLGADTAVPSSFVWTTAAVGAHALTAKAIDNLGAGSQSTVVNIVVGQPPLVVMTVPSSCSAVDGADSLALEADAVSPIGSIALVEFFDGSSVVGSVSKFPYRYTIQNPSIGTHSITARATDHRGFAATSRAAIVTVRSGDQPPSVTITSPSEGTALAFNASVSVSATASDPDGTVASVAFWINNGSSSSLLRTINSAPFSFVATGLAPGSYALTAIAVDDRGVQTTSSPVHFSIASNAPPTVSLTAPTNGSTYVAPAAIGLTASASDSDGSVAKVELFSGTTLIASVSTPPYAATWSNVTAGNYALTAKATDNFGAIATSPAVNISVVANAAPTVNVTAPSNGSTYFAPANVSIAATASDADGTVAQIDFYANGASIGSATSAPYTLSWNGVATGTYAITATATDNRGARTTSNPIAISVLAGPTLTVASGLDGSTLNDDSVRITGHLTAPSNSAININGRIGLVNSSGDFSINNLELALGANTIVATITSQGGQSSSQTINITSSGKSPFVVTVDPDQGFAPLTTKFTVTNRGSVAFGSVEFDFDDNGTTDFTAVPSFFVDGVFSVQALYAAGTWTAAVRVKDTNGNVIHSSKLTVNAFPPAALEGMLRGVYSDMIDRLRVGDIAGALTAVTDPVHDKYNAIFQALQPDLRTIVDQLGSVEDVTFGMDIAEYSIVRDTADGPQRFFIYLIRGADGIWRIEGM